MPARCGSKHDSQLPLLPCWRELVRRAQQLRMPLDEREPLALEEFLRARLAVALRELRLVIEQLQLRRAAGHVQENDLLGPGRKMRRPIGERIDRRAGSSSSSRTSRLARSPSSEASAMPPKPTWHCCKKVPPRDAVQIFVMWVHML